MAGRNIKIDNLLNSKVTLNLKDFNGKIYPIRPKGFVKITEEELSFVMNVSKVFKDGILKVSNKEVLSEDIDKTELESNNALTDEDINTLLKKTQKQLKVELQSIDSIDVIKRILEKANELDKSVKFIEIIEKRLEELIS